jgi:hypothetical protein
MMITDVFFSSIISPRTEAQELKQQQHQHQLYVKLSFQTGTAFSLLFCMHIWMERDRD